MEKDERLHKVRACSNIASVFLKRLWDECPRPSSVEWDVS